MSFSFGFSLEPEVDDAIPIEDNDFAGLVSVGMEEEEETEATEGDSMAIVWEAKQVIPSTDNSAFALDAKEIDDVKVSLRRSGVMNFKKRTFLGDRSSLSEIVKDRDVVSSLYEGGFKVWNCSLDLVGFLENQLNGMAVSDQPQPPRKNRAKVNHLPGGSLRGMRVIDLGCGHGLPGIYSLQQGAKYVAFQDLNHQVLQECTIFNTFLNYPLLGEKERGWTDCGFFSGDWRDDALLTLLERQSYDIILTSDTIYSSASMVPLLSIIKGLLRPPHGVAFVAAKRFYFGVGGGTGEFLDLVNSTSTAINKQETEMYAEVVEVLEDSYSNIREIIKVAFR